VAELHAALPEPRIPVVLVNGRLTESSYGRYRWAGPVARGMFASLAAVCAQEAVFAERFVALGADRQRVRVTGTMKFDTAEIAERVPGDEALAEAVGLDPQREAIWVCGSTGPGEEELILERYRELSGRWPELRLAIIPRKPERFDEVAALIERMEFGLVRRSRRPDGTAPPPSAQEELRPAVVLGDTMGELRKFYSLARVVFVGRTLVDLGPRQHGSDMIEPAALARPVIVGKYAGNFADVMQRLREAKAVREVGDAAGLGRAVGELLENAAGASDMACRAQDVVRNEQGATARHVEVVLRWLGSSQSPVVSRQ
jgi:3-deoxy-D-manno-octulosonic-acid transferase